MHTKKQATWTMKGVVIFDGRTDISFFSLDEEMESFILDRMQELEEPNTSQVS